MFTFLFLFIFKISSEILLQFLPQVGLVLGVKWNCYTLNWALKALFTERHTHTHTHCIFCHMPSRAFVTVTHVQAHARTQTHAQPHAQRLQQMHWGNLGLTFLPRATSAYGLEELGIKLASSWWITCCWLYCNLKVSAWALGHLD